MKIYFLARFDLSVKIDNLYISLKDGEIAFLDEMFNGNITIESLDQDIDGYTFSFLELQESKCLFAKYHKLDDDNILIELMPKYVYLPCNQETKMILFNNQIVFIEIINKCLIKINTLKDSFYIKKGKLIDFYYEIYKSLKEILVLKFVFEVGEYYYITNEEKEHFKGFVKEINFKNNHLILLLDDVSVYGQKRVIDYDVKEDKQDQYFVYADERCVFEKLDVKYLFLDCIKIKNFNLSKRYLSKELGEIGEEYYFEFFKDFDNYRFIENTCLLEKNNEVIKIIHFDVFEDEIINICD